MAIGDSDSGIDWLIGILLVILVASVVLPQALGSLNTMADDSANFSLAQRSLIALIGTVVLIMFVYRIYKGKQ